MADNNTEEGINFINCWDDSYNNPVYVTNLALLIEHKQAAVGRVIMYSFEVLLEKSDRKKRC